MLINEANLKCVWESVLCESPPLADILLQGTPLLGCVYPSETGRTYCHRPQLVRSLVLRLTLHLVLKNESKLEVYRYECEIFRLR